MGLIERLRHRPTTNGRLRVWSSEDPDVLDVLDAEDAAILAAAKPVGPVADVTAALADILGIVGRATERREQPVQDAAPGPVRGRDVLRRWLRDRRMPEDGE